MKFQAEVEVLERREGRRPSLDQTAGGGFENGGDQHPLVGSQDGVEVAVAKAVCLLNEAGNREGVGA